MSTRANLTLVFHKTTRHVLAAALLNQPRKEPTVADFVGSSLDMQFFARIPVGAVTNKVTFDLAQVKIRPEHLDLMVVTNRASFRDVPLKPSLYAANIPAKPEDADAKRLQDPHFNVSYNSNQGHVIITPTDPITAATNVAIHAAGVETVAESNFPAANGTNQLAVSFNPGPNTTKVLVLIAGFEPLIISS